MLGHLVTAAPGTHVSFVIVTTICKREGAKFQEQKNVAKLDMLSPPIEESQNIPARLSIPRTSLAMLALHAKCAVNLWRITGLRHSGH